MEGMETPTSWLFEGYLLSFKRANASECLAQMELGKHLSLIWYGTIEKLMFFRSVDEMCIMSCIL
jgi:hypothetical protein